MNKLFNTVFETEMRIVLLLNNSERAYSSSRINALDSKVLYSEDFPFNQHIDDVGRKSELNTRFKLIKAALKQGIADGYFELQINDDGFYYSLSRKGCALANAFSDDYADAYSSVASRTCEEFKNVPDIEIMKSLLEYRG